MNIQKFKKAKMYCWRFNISSSNPQYLNDISGKSKLLKIKK